MQTHLTLPLRALLQNGLKPPLGLGAHVGEHQGRLFRFDSFNNLFDHALPEMPRPGKDLPLLRHQGLDLWKLEGGGTNQTSVQFTPQKCLHGFMKISQGGGQPPCLQAGTPLPETGKAQLGLDASLGGEQFMPLVDHHRLQSLKGMMGALIGK